MTSGLLIEVEKDSDKGVVACLMWSIGLALVNALRNMMICSGFGVTELAGWPLRLNSVSEVTFYVETECCVPMVLCVVLSFSVVVKHANGIVSYQQLPLLTTSSLDDTLLNRLLCSIHLGRSKMYSLEDQFFLEAD